MVTDTPFAGLSFHELFNSLLPDFVLGFAFFTALSYTVLARRFERQRAAIAVSAVIGLALSTGLVSWEAEHGVSIRNLGYIAIGIAVLLVGVLLFHAIRRIGGTWGGTMLALGLALLLAGIVELPMPFDRQIIQTVLVILILFGLVAVIEHHHVEYRRVAPVVLRERRIIRDNVREIDRNARVSSWLGRGIHDLQRRGDDPHDRSDAADDAIRQLHRMMPEQGWLTGRVADLRTKMHRVREGHVARIEEIQHRITTLAPEAKRQVSRELVRRFKELKLDVRLDRLDRAVAENERRIRQVTQEAEQAASRYEYQRLFDLLKYAEKLQRHNTKLFQIMGKTEHRLDALARKVATESTEVNNE